MQRGSAAADPQFEAAVAEDVGDRGFLGDLDRVVHRQQRHRRAEADAARPLGRGGQHHQRIGKYRKAPAEVKLAEPYRIEPDLVAEFYLRQNVLIALLLGISGRARQLVKEPEAHVVPSKAIGDSPRTTR